MAAAAGGLEFRPRHSRGQRMAESPEEESSDEVGAPAEGADEDVAAIVRPMSTQHLRRRVGAHCRERHRRVGAHYRE